MSKTGAWSHNATDALIDAFKKHPCLHYRRRFVDSNDVKYANLNIQMKLDSLGYKFTMSEIVKKMTNLQIYYHQLRLKPRHEIGWSYFNKLTFLEKKYTNQGLSHVTSSVRPTFVHVTKERTISDSVFDPNNNDPTEECRETEQSSSSSSSALIDHDHSMDNESTLSNDDQQVDNDGDDDNDDDDDEEIFTGVPSMVSPRKDHSAFLPIDRQSNQNGESSNDNKNIQGDSNHNNHHLNTTLNFENDDTSTKNIEHEEDATTMEFIEINGDKVVILPSTRRVVKPESLDESNEFRKPSDPKKDISLNGDTTQRHHRKDSLPTNETASLPHRTHNKITTKDVERRESIDQPHYAQQTLNGRDEDDHYGWSVSNMLRAIPDCDEKRRLKYEIHENIKRVYHFIMNNNIPFSSQHYYPPHYQHPSPPLVGQPAYHMIPRELGIGHSPYHVISPEQAIGYTPHHVYYHQPSYESCLIVGKQPSPKKNKKNQHKRSPYKKTSEH